MGNIDYTNPAYAKYADPPETKPVDAEATDASKVNVAQPAAVPEPKDQAGDAKKED